MRVLSSFILTMALVTSYSASASRSSVSPFSSKDFDVTLAVQSHLSLKDQDGKAVVLGTNGALLLSTENSTQLSPDQLTHRTVTHVNFAYDDQAKKSSMTIETQGGLLDFGSGRAVTFNLPQEIVIDNNGYPAGIDHVTAPAAVSGQNVDVAINLTSPGNWTPYSYDGTQSCSFVRYETICDQSLNLRAPDGDDHGGGDHHGGGGDDHGGGGYDHEPHCHVIAITVMGFQNYHVQGEKKSDGYTVSLGQAAQVNFDLNYDNSQESFGPCYLR